MGPWEFELVLSVHPVRVAIHTHGCKLNQADSAVLARQFVAAGYTVVESPRVADVFILNTCTVTANADAKARQALRAARRANPQALIVATGCYPQRSRAELSRLDAVSLVVDNTEKAQLVPLVTARLESQHDGGQAHPPETSMTPVPLALGRSRAMLKIQEGCNQVCAYCIVPKVRGRERSIPTGELVRQVREQLAEGYREVTLTGTQLGSYGFDIPGEDLPSLLRAILGETDVHRLRVSSLQPQEIGPELLALWEDRRLCPHFHVPLQSGSDRTLRAMRRRYDTQRFAATVEEIRCAYPDAGITADVIVGFPGETEQDFRETCDFVKSVGFSDLHVFPFSSRPGTGAAHLPDDVPPAAKKERVAQMMSLAAQGFRNFRLRQLGQERPVLWESKRGDGAAVAWSGLTDNYIRVCAESPRDLRNSITPARLLRIVDSQVYAEVAAPAEE